MTRNAIVSNNKTVIRIIIYNVLITLYDIKTVIGFKTDLKDCKQN